MSVTIDSLINEILRKTTQRLDGSDLVTREDCLTFINTARRQINRYVNVSKGEERVKAVANQYLYNLPLDFKSNLYRVEYDGEPLVKANLAVLDEYDPKWRNSGERNPPDSSPQYYVPDTPGRKFIVYPPPATTGTSQDMTAAGLPEEITLAGETVDFPGPGMPESVEIGGEILEFTEPGFPEILVALIDNFTLFYDKHFFDLDAAAATADSAITLDSELEPHQETIKYWALFSIYSLERKKDVDLARLNLDFYNSDMDRIADELRLLRPPVQVSVHRQAGLSWGRRARMGT
jgi:hypothetical protein